MISGSGGGYCRELMVHEYGGINDHIAYAAMQRLMPRLRRFSEEVLVWLTIGRI
jgi:uncharacterized protein YutE (UPF0331/DUF86 family)